MDKEKEQPQPQQESEKTAGTQERKPETQEQTQTQELPEPVKMDKPFFQVSDAMKERLRKLYHPKVRIYAHKYANGRS